MFFIVGFVIIFGFIWGLSLLREIRTSQQQLVKIALANAELKEGG